MIEKKQMLCSKAAVANRIQFHCLWKMKEHAKVIHFCGKQCVALCIHHDSRADCEKKQITTDKSLFPKHIKPLLYLLTR